MNHPKILVTGATGKTGSEVVAQLRQKNVPVRAAVRTRDARSARLEQLGAEVVVADYFDPGHWRDALRGVGRAYYCPPFHAHMIQGAVAFAVAAQEAKLESIVGLSQWLASPAHPSLTTRQHWLTDHLFSLLPETMHTTINPGFFAEYPYLFLMPYAAHLGIFPMPVDAASRNAPPSIRDIASVAVAALLDPARHAGQVYRPTGPQLLSVTEMTEILGRVLGRKVRHVKMPLWMFFKAARLDGISPLELSGFRHYVAEHDRGTFALGAPTNQVFETTGREPEDFATIVRRHAALPEIQPTLRNRLATFVKFMRVPLQPGFQPDRFEREHSHPRPPQPQLAADSADWRHEHGIDDRPASNAHRYRSAQPERLTLAGGAH